MAAVVQCEHSKSSSSLHTNTIALTLLSPSFFPFSLLLFTSSGHYDCIYDTREVRKDIIRSAPGIFEDNSIKRLRNIHRRRTVEEREERDMSSALSSTEEVEINRITLETAMIASRNEITSRDDDLQMCLAMSFDGHGHNASTSPYSSKDTAKSVDPPSNELSQVQDDIVRSIVAQSEREFLEKAIEDSVLESSFSTEKQSLSSSSPLASRHNQIVTSPHNEIGSTDKLVPGYGEMSLAQQMSDYSEQEALEMAMKRSMEGGNGNATPAHCQSTDFITPDYIDDEEAMLQAIINDSILNR